MRLVSCPRGFGYIDSLSPLASRKPLLNNVPTPAAHQSARRRTDFTLQLLWDTYGEIRAPSSGSNVPAVVWLGFCTAALTISSLNYYWFSLMMKTLVDIYSKGATWGAASQGKNE